MSYWSSASPFHLHNSIIRFSSPFYFADDTDLLNIQDSICTINKTINKDCRELSFWLNANKITFIVAKPEIILFKTNIKTMMRTIKLSSAEKGFMHSRMLNIPAFLPMET